MKRSTHVHECFSYCVTICGKQHTMVLPHSKFLFSIKLRSDFMSGYVGGCGTGFAGGGFALLIVLFILLIIIGASFCGGGFF